MQNTLIEKYLDFKRKSLISYSSVFYKLYPSQEESIWKNEKEFDEIMSSIIDTYLEKYYFREKKELQELNKNNYTKEEFKLAIALAIIAETYKNKYEELKQKYKKGLYNLTVIVYIITNIDKDINILMDSVTLTPILEVLRNYFKYINQEMIMDKNPFIIDILGNKIKDNTRLSKKFFDTIDSKEAYNLFAKYDEDFYFTKFIFDNSLLDKYKEVDVEKVYSKYKLEEEYYEISYELASLTILKQYSLNGKVKGLILPITANYLKDEKNINFISKTFSNPFIKNKIKFSVVYSEYQKNRDIFNTLRDMKFKLVLYMDKDEMILDYSNIKIDLSIYAKKKFIDNNPKFLDFTNKANIECKVVDKNAYLTELELLKSCEEE